jgi:hypothetical protein
VAAWRDAATIGGAKVVQSRFLSVDGVITYGGVDGMHGSIRSTGERPRSPSEFMTDGNAHETCLSIVYGVKPMIWARALCPSEPMPLVFS